MAAQQHTPGPWKVIENAGGNFQHGIGTALGAPIPAMIAYVDVKSVATDKDSRLANARLISAAPRMVKVLQWAAKVLAELPMAEQGPPMLSLRSEIVATIQEATPEYYGVKAKYTERRK